MSVRICVLLCAILVTVQIQAFSTRDLSATPSPNVLASLQTNLDEFRKCLDKTMAKTVDEVNVKQLQPVFNVIGDQINRFSKAFEDLTATSKKPSIDLDF